MIPSESAILNPPSHGSEGGLNKEKENLNPRTHQAKNQYSAAYCLEKAVGIPAHVAGAAPPAVFTL